MAAGKPVVASDIEGYRGIMQHGEQGLLYRNKDSDALASALELLVRNPELRQELGGRGRETAERYRWNLVAKQVEDYYESCRESRRETLGREFLEMEANGAAGTRPV
jgi:phosphatidylinositol alpha-mannosyltransferase